MTDAICQYTPTAASASTPAPISSTRRARASASTPAEALPPGSTGPRNCNSSGQASAKARPISVMPQAMATVSGSSSRSAPTTAPYRFCKLALTLGSSAWLMPRPASRPSTLPSALHTSVSATIANVSARTLTPIKRSVRSVGRRYHSEKRTALNTMNSPTAKDSRLIAVSWVCRLAVSWVRSSRCWLASSIRSAGKAAARRAAVSGEIGPTASAVKVSRPSSESAAPTSMKICRPCCSRAAISAGGRARPSRRTSCSPSATPSSSAIAAGNHA